MEVILMFLASKKEPFFVLENVSKTYGRALILLKEVNTEVLHVECAAEMRGMLKWQN